MESFVGTDILPMRGYNGSSVFIQGELSGQKVLLKLSFDYQDPFDNRNKVESSLYQKVISVLLKNTPHLLKYYGSEDCSTVSFSDEKLSKEFQKRIKIVEEDSPEPVNLKSASALFLEETSGETFGTLLNSFSEDEILIILFQIFYTLQCFERVNLIHGDLHLNNVFVERTKETISYSLDGKVYLLKTGINAKIFDFDRSRCYNPEVSRNFALDGYFCSKYGQCNYNDNTFDAYLLLSSLYVRTKNSLIRELISSLISTEVVKEDYEEDSVGYKYKTRTDQKCKSISECLRTVTQVLLQREILSKSDDIEAYSLPPKVELKITHPTVSLIEKQNINTFFFQSSPASEEETFERMLKNWDYECKTSLSTSPEANMYSLLNSYVKARGIYYEEEDQKEDFFEIVSPCTRYLSYPMFYKLDRKQLSLLLSRSELMIIGDIIRVLSPLPISIPQI